MTASSAPFPTATLAGGPEAAPGALPVTSVDVVIFTVREEWLEVLLVQRNEEPARGSWALPGGCIQPDLDLDLEHAALRKLKEKTGVETPYLEQLQTVGNSRRDPRGWSLTVVFFALIPSDRIRIAHGNGTRDARWVPIVGTGVENSLAFDHNEILATAVERLRNKVEYTALPIHLMPDEFTLTDLQRVFETVLARPVNKGAFRRRIRDAGIVQAVHGKKRLGSNRPAQLYRVKPSSSGHFFQRTLIRKDIGEGP